jgi:hypothetical protein
MNQMRRHITAKYPITQEAKTVDEGLIKLGIKKQRSFMDDVIHRLPESGNLNLCLTCGA